MLEKEKAKKSRLRSNEFAGLLSQIPERLCVRDQLRLIATVVLSADSKAFESGL